MSFEIINLYTLSLISLIYILLNWKKIKNIGIEQNNLLEKNSRVYFFDFIKGIAILAVFIGHISFFYRDGLNDNLSNISYLIIKIVRFCIPFFIISSGVLLKLENHNLKNILAFYKRKFFRIIVPYFLFCIILFFTKEYKDFSLFIKDVFTGNISGQFYFITILVQLYLFYPIINKLIQKIGDKKSLIYSFIVSVLSFIFLEKILGFEPFISYLFFSVFGIVFKKYFDNVNFNKLLKDIRFIRFSSIVLVLYMFFCLINIKEFYSNFQMIYAPTLFLLFYYFKDKLSNKKIYKIFSFFGKNSLYIFLIHIMIMEYIYKYLNLISMNIYLEYVLFIVVSFILAFLTPAIISSIIKRNLKTKKFKSQN